MNPTVDDRLTTGSTPHLKAALFAVDGDPQLLAAVYRVAPTVGRARRP
jgi:hypothetical protein